MVGGIRPTGAIGRFARMICRPITSNSGELRFNCAPEVADFSQIREHFSASDELQTDKQVRVVLHTASTSINQSINQSISQSVSQSVSLSVSQSVNQKYG